MERSVSTTEAGALHGGLRAEDECRVVEEVGEGGSKVGKRAGAAKGKDVVGVSVEVVAEKEVGGSADVRSGQEWVGLEACEDNIIRLRMRLPKAEMVWLVKESRNVAEKKL
ncbi:hypothetical protein [Oryza sativa Japonica Group]|uniref:Uncharacterized protein n=1 Tax=Oryza sativa subsp. japonica TaxID=39947 RepID=Q657D3_ORYSJ|nr:hypothetical protein [Oryza sativa Japonica Group]BAD45084.1 hypothetical protein [Oryza sativa Japonica Group]